MVEEYEMAMKSIRGVTFLSDPYRGLLSRILLSGRVFVSRYPVFLWGSQIRSKGAFI